MDTWVSRFTFIRVIVVASAAAMMITAGAAFGTRLLTSDYAWLLGITVVLGELAGSWLTKRPGWQASMAGVVALAVGQGVAIGMAVAGASSLATTYGIEIGTALIDLVMPMLYSAAVATTVAALVVCGFPRLVEKAHYLTIPISAASFVIGSCIAGFAPEISGALGFGGMAFGYYASRVWSNAVRQLPTLNNAFDAAARFVLDFLRFLRGIQARRARARQ